MTSQHKIKVPFEKSVSICFVTPLQIIPIVSGQMSFLAWVRQERDMVWSYASKQKYAWSCPQLSRRWMVPALYYVFPCFPLPTSSLLCYSWDLLLRTLFELCKGFKIVCFPLPIQDPSLSLAFYTQFINLQLSHSSHKPRHPRAQCIQTFVLGARGSSGNKIYFNKFLYEREREAGSM